MKKFVRRTKTFCCGTKATKTYLDDMLDDVLNEIAVRIRKNARCGMHINA
jgi:hypothetical protein